MRNEGRPVLAVAATPGATGRLRPLARELAKRVDLRSLDQINGRPDGVLAASVDALRAAPATVPVAVWVADAGEMAALIGSHVVRVCLSVDREAIEGGAIAVPADALDAVACAVVPPLVRARQRARDGLSPELIVDVTVAVTDGGADALTMLAVAAAAVVTGPLLATALALGTPTVTTPEEADRLGLRAGEEVEVAEPDSWDALLGALATDEARAARLSLAGRRFAERTLDLGHIAAVLVDRLGLFPARSDPRGLLDQRLAELLTPSGASIRARAAIATECFQGKG